jgi:formylglycine-generating enzyme required for sulfatase activity
MIVESCILILSGASFTAPTICAADPNSEIAVISKTLLVNPPKLTEHSKTPAPKQVNKKPIDHSRPSASKMNMVTIQPGVFIMGSPKDEARRDANEGPQREVVIPTAFEIGKYEVTFNDWNTCVVGGGCRGYRPDDGGWGKGRRPVINISWNQMAE